VLVHAPLPPDVWAGRAGTARDGSVARNYIILFTAGQRQKFLPSSMREALERRHDPLAHGWAPLVPGVLNEAQLSIRPRSRELPGCVWRAAHIVPAMQQHARNAGEAVRVAQEHAFFEPCGVREIVRGDADEGDARRRWSVAVRRGRAVRLGPRDPAPPR